MTFACPGLYLQHAAQSIVSRSTYMYSTYKNYNTRVAKKKIKYCRRFVSETRVAFVAIRFTAHFTAVMISESPNNDKQISYSLC